jgi:hypothetical protein
LIEAIILCERCAVDHFTLVSSAACQSVASLFPDVCVPVSIGEQERNEVYDRILSLTTDDPARELLQQERDLVSQIYYGGKSTAKEAKTRERTFAARYYDPRDTFKHEAIEKGLYDPLNLLRTRFYVELANRSGIPYMPHPLRERFLSSAIHRRKSVSISVARHITRPITQMLDEIRESISEVKVTTAPPLAAMVLLEAREPKYVPEVVMSIRDSKKARRFRAWSKEFREALTEGPRGATKAQKMWKAVQEVAEKWKRDLDEEVKYRTRSLKIALGPEYANVDVDFVVKDPILSVRRKYRPFLLLNDVFRGKR